MTNLQSVQIGYCLQVLRLIAWFTAANNDQLQMVIVCTYGLQMQTLLRSAYAHIIEVLASLKSMRNSMRP